MEKSKVLAAIDVGSASIRMKIIQVVENGETQVLENVVRSVAIGRDTFSKGRISPEMVEEVCQVLLGFQKILREYKVRLKRVVATSAMREAANRDYVLEQIRVRTGFSIEILARSEERYLTRQAAFAAVPDFRKRAAKGLLYTHIGSGSAQIAAYHQEGLTFSQSTQMGALRIRQMLSSIEEQTLRFPQVMEEFMISNTDFILKEENKEQYEHFMISGGVCANLYQLCKGKEPEKEYALVSAEQFEEVYRKVLSMSSKDIAEKYDLDPERAELIVPSLLIVHTFCGITKAKEILFSFAGLSDGVLWELAGTQLQRVQSFEDVLSYTRTMADMFRCDMEHAKQVNEYAMMLFDALGKAHDLTPRHRLMLQIGVLLHDSGKFLGVNDHAAHSATIVRSAEFTGITGEEQNMIAMMVRFHESSELAVEDLEFAQLGRKNRLALAKLTGILRLANAMDYSHRRKLKNVKVSIHNGRLVISAAASQNATLENWKMQSFVDDIQDVFGLRLEFGIKRGH
ncbi:MAG: hypothetical protein IJ315_10330 [Firmicutes bacterium]|nr:hypothetical protein [Bacillota bacterium]